MKWLVTGGEGQLGRELAHLIGKSKPTDIVVALSRHSLDITNSHNVNSVLAAEEPDVVVNCAAWTKVDLAESNEVETMAVNATGAANLAQGIEQLGNGMLVQVSTDYVFGADTSGPHREDDEIAPVGVYARSKALAEETVRRVLPSRHAIVRTAWLYGEYGSNFARTIIEKLRSGHSLRIVNDQLGQPTYTRDVAGRIVEIVDLIRANSAAAGTFHAVNSGSATWWQFGAAIAELMNMNPDIIQQISSTDLNLAAQRPMDSRLADLQGIRWDLSPMRPWREALEAALPRLRDLPSSSV